MNEPLKAGDLLAGHYKLLTQIGAGGFGTVYKARDQHKIGKLVAIKEINMAALNTQEKIEVTDSFNREITLLSNLTHKSLPRIYDQFTDPEHWYIVMEYIEGQTLEDLLARAPDNRLPTKQAVKIATALCDVLTYLHDQTPSIIFRDIKPGNIMLTPWGRIYLIDFGIARRYQPGKARDTGSLGSPGYAAPEQYGRTQTTTRTDIYGLGMTLQTLLTGKEPLEIRQQGLPPDVQIPWKLQTLINQMTDSDPLKRPGSTREVKHELPFYGPPLQSWWIVIQCGYMSLAQSYFSDSPYMQPYLRLTLLFLVISCLFTFLRARRVAPLPLSLKAAMLIMRNQLLSSAIIAGALSMVISLAYVFLTRPLLSGWHLFFLWLFGVGFVIAILTTSITWLRNRQQLATKQPPAAQRQQQAQSR